MTPREIKALLAGEGFRHRRLLGQNFLLDPSLLEAIADAGDVREGDCVLEVGTGAGTLTRVLARRASAVVTVEIDKRLHEAARIVTGAPPHIAFVHGDALGHGDGPRGALLEEVEARLAAAAKEGLRVTCVSNFPYAVATPLVIRLCERALVDGAFPLALIAGTVQRELGLRWRAAPGEKCYGAPAAELQALARVAVCRAVSRGAFWPAPKVESVIVRLDPRPPEERPSGLAWVRFRDLVRATFPYRRKTVANALQRGLGISGDEARAALAQAAIDPGLRVEAIPVAALRALAEASPQRKNSASGSE